MDAKTLLERLFPGGCDVAFDGIYFSGDGAKYDDDGDI